MSPFHIALILPIEFTKQATSRVLDRMALFTFWAGRIRKLRAAVTGSSLARSRTALNAVEQLQEGVVIAIDSHGAETKIICCAYVPTPGIDLPPAALRKLLSRSLPNYMLPVRWLIYDLLPRNTSGKIDRRALKEEFIQYDTQTHGPAAGDSHAAGVAAG